MHLRQQCIYGNDVPGCELLWITCFIIPRLCVRENGDMTHDLLLDLDDAQRSAASAVEGPVRIIAGAGAGKTRTIMHRIAYACQTGAWDPERSLAVTFSTKAAQEMQSRLQALGVGQVHAATFHSAALQQLRSVWDDLSESPFPQVTDNAKDLVFRALARSTGRDSYQELEVQDVQAEIDWAKVGLIAPSDYGRACRLLGRVPPLGMECIQMKSVMEAYEEEKAYRGQIDFNDILLLVCHILDEDSSSARQIRSHIDSLTVDEYQDVSPLQHRLVQLWLKDNRNICVVGDPAQTIYSFAGATSYYLINFSREFSPVTADIQLATDYRSTRNIVKEANKILKPSPVRDDYLFLESARDTGRRISKRMYSCDDEESRSVVEKIKRLIHKGEKAEDIAVLMRINSQGKILAQYLQKAKIAYRVRTESDWVSQAGHDSMMNADGSVGQISLSTIHASKGLEWKRVFIIGCSEGLIPFSSSKSDDALEEERRLLYVGITRAQDNLEISYAQAAHPQETGGVGGSVRQPSRFLL